MEHFVYDDAGEAIRLIDMGDNFKLSVYGTAESTKEVFDNVPGFELRPDDVMLCTYPKTGTHWLFEVMSMLLAKSHQRVKTNKMYTMLDFLPREVIDKQPSPRVMNSHFPPRYLPRDMKTKQTKTVLCLRNPKDTAVSFYHHMTGFTSYGYSGQWNNWIRPYLLGQLEYCTYTSYLNEWQKVIEEGVGFPLHILYFEDMKLNAREEVDRLANFLGVDIDETLRDDVIAQSSFEKMVKKNDTYKDELGIDELKDGFNFFRKGQIGDWKNWFTVGQNEMFDEVWNREIRNDTMFKFKYTQRL